MTPLSSKTTLYTYHTKEAYYRHRLQTESTRQRHRNLRTNELDDAKAVEIGDNFLKAKHLRPNAKEKFILDEVISF
jgi:hypothetical protein